MTRHRSLRTSYAVFACAAAAASPALAADIFVPKQVPTIQAAIDLAQSGDRVLVSPGIYAEQIDFSGKNIIIESTAGPETTTIDGGGAVGFVITANSGESVTLIGFTVTGGFGQAGSLGAGPGGGMVIDGGSALIDNCAFISNTGILGGGLSIIEGDAIVRGTQFENNRGLHGGGLYIEQGELTVENCVFHHNFATNFGGAIAIFWLTEATVTDSEFTNNSANSFGGAIYTNHADIDFDRLSIVGNGRAEPGLHNSWIISTFGGGGIYTTSTNGRINASRIRNNIAAAGTGLYVAGSGMVEVVNTLIAENGSICNCGQGAVYVNSSNPVITNSTIVKNGGFTGLFTTYNAFPTVRNTIIAGQLNNLNSQNPIAGNGLSNVSFSLLQGMPFASNSGAGNIITEDFPLLNLEGDFEPLLGSAAIDTGDNSAVPAGITTDLLGNERIVGGAVDIGAIEFRPLRSLFKRGSHYGRR